MGGYSLLLEVALVVMLALMGFASVMQSAAPETSTIAAAYKSIKS